MIVAGVATLALTGVAVGTGIVYKSRQKTYNELNDDPTTSFADVDASRKDAETMGTINLVTSIGAGVGAVATIVLFVVRPKAEPPTTAFTPWVSPAGAGASVLHRF